jgi:2',3'-cyclic-nucleotide 2'-phosphodiesterase (5'-nucleotidase family)
MTMQSVGAALTALKISELRKKKRLNGPLLLHAGDVHP